MPLRYYDNNVAGTVQLLYAMERHDVRDLVFSSSCTVYGEPDTVPINEDTPLGASSPYGRTKLHIEEMLRDVAATGAGWRIALLRYFNPVGAHPSGLIGEDPIGIPNNLMPYIMQVAVGRRDHLAVHGGDYPTPDGTAVRDYLHVVDLAEGHLAALDHLDAIDGAVPVNLGTGTGSSVLDVVRAASSRGRTRPSLRDRADGAPATWSRCGPTRRGPHRCCTGARRARWPTCAPTTGAGSRRTPTATAAERFGAPTAYVTELGRQNVGLLEDLVGGEEGRGELGAQAAVEGDGDAGEEAGAVGREEPRQLGDVLGTTEPSDRDLPRGSSRGRARSAGTRASRSDPGRWPPPARRSGRSRPRCCA